MDNKGSTFIDAIVAVLIISIIFVTLSNYSGHIVKSEENFSKNLSNQISINNLIEEVYSEQDWSYLTNSKLGELNILYKDYEKDGNLEKVNLVISRGSTVKSYLLERSLL